jgi:predicted transcriptional regulator
MCPMCPMCPKQEFPERIRLATMNTTKTNSPGPTASAILVELDRQGKTRYWLMKQANLDSPTVYGYLQGSLDCRISTVERMMGALNMGYHQHDESQGVPRS